MIESCLPVPMSDGGYRREEERGNYDDEKVNIDLGLISGCWRIDVIMKKTCVAQNGVRIGGLYWNTSLVLLDILFR